MAVLAPRNVLSMMITPADPLGADGLVGDVRPLPPPHTERLVTKHV